MTRKELKKYYDKEFNADFIKIDKRYNVDVFEFTKNIKKGFKHLKKYRDYLTNPDYSPVIIIDKNFEVSAKYVLQGFKDFTVFSTDNFIYNEQVFSTTTSMWSLDGTNKALMYNVISSFVSYIIED